MKLLEKINTINDPKLKSLKNGDYKSIKDFWDSVIVPNLPSDSTIKSYHKLLINYVNSVNPTLAMRAHYEEANGHINLRRGWFNRITDDDGQMEFFFTDNFFAHYFTKMASDNYVPDLKDFYDMMKSRKFPFRYKFKLCQEEFEKLSFTMGKNPGINGNTGYYLAHILGTGTNYSYNGKSFGTKYIETNYFDCGDRNDYVEKTDFNGKYYIRDYGTVTDKAYRKILVASFIRFTHPINNFICPNKKSCISNIGDKSGIGESIELLDYARNYFMKKFPAEYKEFLDLSLAPTSYYLNLPGKNVLANIHCEINCNKTSKSATTKASTKVTTAKSSTTKKVNSLSKANETERQIIISKTNHTFHTINKLLELITNIIHTLNDKGLLTQDDMDMLTSDRSKKIFGTRLCVVVEEGSTYDTGRYGKGTKFTFNGKDYLIVNDWYEKDAVYNWIRQWALIKGFDF